MTHIGTQIGPELTFADLDKQIDALLPAYDAGYEDLIYYDGPIVSMTHAAIEGSFVLRIAVGDRRPTDPRIVEILHYLYFPTAEAAEATMHSENIPTRQSYIAATKIDRLVLSYPANQAGHDYRASLSSPSFDEIPADELPYDHLLPGRNRMQFKANGYIPLQNVTGPHYQWNGPVDAVLMSYDGPRVWIERARSAIDPKQQWFLLINAEDDDDGRQVHYRLAFETEKALRATLYKGYAQTNVSYQQASSITRETLVVTNDPDQWQLDVEEVSFEDIPAAHLATKDIQPCPA